MATKAKLLEKLAELGVTADTEGLTNAELSALIKDAESQDLIAEPPKFVVKQGATITTRRGIVSGGAEVTERDFVTPGSLRELVELGYIDELTATS